MDISARTLTLPVLPVNRCMKLRREVPDESGLFFLTCRSVEFDHFLLQCNLSLWNQWAGKQPVHKRWRSCSDWVCCVFSRIQTPCIRGPFTKCRERARENPFRYALLPPSFGRASLVYAVWLRTDIDQLALCVSSSCIDTYHLTHTF